MRKSKFSDLALDAFVIAQATMRQYSQFPPADHQRLQKELEVIIADEERGGESAGELAARAIAILRQQEQIRLSKERVGGRAA